MKKFHILIFVLGFFISTVAISGPRRGSNSSSKKKSSRVLMAKKAKRKGKKSGSREKRIVREESYKSKSGKNKTSIDFDAVDIGGQRKSPLGSLVDQSKANLDYDFIKIRLSWHPEMIQSAQSLESGSN